MDAPRELFSYAAYTDAKKKANGFTHENFNTHASIQGHVGLCFCIL